MYPIITSLAHSRNLPVEDWARIEKNLQGRVDQLYAATIVLASIAIVEFILIAALIAILAIRARARQPKTKKRSHVQPEREVGSSLSSN